MEINPQESQQPMCIPNNSDRIDLKHRPSASKMQVIATGQCLYTRHIHARSSQRKSISFFGLGFIWI